MQQFNKVTGYDEPMKLQYVSTTHEIPQRQMTYLDLLKIRDGLVNMADALKVLCESIAECVGTLNYQMSLVREENYGRDDRIERGVDSAPGNDTDDGGAEGA